MTENSALCSPTAGVVVILFVGLERAWGDINGAAASFTSDDHPWSTECF